MRSFLPAILFFLWLLPAIYSQKTIILQPGPAQSKDSYINSAFPDSSFGAQPGWIACAWTFGGQFGIGRSMIRFDLSQIPAGAEILDARITLYYDPAVAYGLQTGENASLLERITADWNELTVTWSNRPPSTPAGAIFIPPTTTTSQDISDINITAFVSEWLLHPETNFGVVHKMTTEIEYCCLVCSSSESPNAARRPKLVVTYRDCDPPVAGFSFAMQIPSVNFTDTSGSASSWFWDFGDGYFSNLENPQHAYAAQGVYTVCLTVNDSCGSDTRCENVHVCEMPDPGFYYTANAQMVSFRDSSTLPQSWFWDFGDGFYSDLKDPEHYFNESGTYYVCEKVTNACNVQTFCDSVKIFKNAIENQSNTFGLRVYPNPALDFIIMRLNVPVGSIAVIELFSMQSSSLRQWVREIKPGYAPISLSLAGLSQGIYFLQTKIDGIIQLNKLIIL